MKEKRFCNVIFADDIVLIADARHKAEVMPKELTQAIKEAELQKKSKTLF